MPALPGTHHSWVSWSNVSEVSCSRKHNYKSCLTFPNYTAGLTGAMWVKFLLKETTNSTIQESNQDLLNHKPILNHCCCCPTEHIVIIKLNPQNSLNSLTHCHYRIFYLMLTVRHIKCSNFWRLNKEVESIFSKVNTLIDCNY